MKIKLLDRNFTRLTVSEFYDNYGQEKYDFDTPYQRKSGVWSDDKQSFLIDSILKNYPMPPIFMRPNIGDDGKTKYDIIDGKQRLNSIIGFIEGRVPLTSYFSEDGEVQDPENDLANEINGKSFDEIKNDKRFSDFVRQFWTYSINIDYLYENDPILISNIFDRLNRNGEPLNYQELRNAKFNRSTLLSSIRKLTKNKYWSERLQRLKDERMEDEEFVSELFFLTAKNEIIESSPQKIDELYEEYAKKTDLDINSISESFMQITNFIINLEFDYTQLKKLSSPTHLYGLFSFAWYCSQNNVTEETVKTQLAELYTEYFGKRSTEYPDNLSNYKASCSSRTRSKDQRARRLNAIKSYCNIN